MNQNDQKPLQKPLIEIIDPIIGLPYSEYDCWRLLTYIFKHGKNVQIENDPLQSINLFEEIWYKKDNLSIPTLQEYDVVAFNIKGLAADHVGVLLDQNKFVHTRKKVGVCTESISRWIENYDKLIFIYRYKENK